MPSSLNIKNRRNVFINAFGIIATSCVFALGCSVHDEQVVGKYAASFDPAEP